MLRPQIKRYLSVKLGGQIVIKQLFAKPFQARDALHSLSRIALATTSVVVGFLREIKLEESMP